MAKNALRVAGKITIKDLAVVEFLSRVLDMVRSEMCEKGESFILAKIESEAEELLDTYDVCR